MLNGEPVVAKSCYTVDSIGAFHPDVEPPTIDSCMSDLTVECSSLLGTPKTDAQLSAFFLASSATDSCDLNPSISNDAPDLFPVQESTQVMFSAEDSDGNSAICMGLVTVRDTTSPTIGFQVSDRVTLYPDKKYHDLDLLSDFGVITSDTCCDTQNTIHITNIESNESNLPGTGKAVRSGKKKKRPDFTVTGATTLSVKAYRDKMGDGRVYTIFFEVTDCHDQISSSEAFVYVPRHRPH